LFFPHHISIDVHFNFFVYFSLNNQVGSEVYKICTCITRYGYTFIYYIVSNLLRDNVTIKN